MVCIYCSSPTQVKNSRLQRRANQTWRRRRCTACDSIFTTLESADLGTSLVVQYSPKVLRPFQRDTLLLSIYEAVKHRPTAIQDASALTGTILGFLLAEAKDGAIGRDTVVAVAARTLKRFDKTASTIYLAYHPA